MEVDVSAINSEWLNFLKACTLFFNLVAIAQNHRIVLERRGLLSRVNGWGNWSDEREQSLALKMLCNPRRQTIPDVLKLSGSKGRKELSYTFS